MHPEIEREVAWFVASLTAALDPSIVIFGGSAGRALIPHLLAIEQHLRSLVIKGSPVPFLTIAERADAGLLGAALLADENR